MDTPVAFFVFNRPELTRRVFAEIRRAKPARLFLIADGPRFPAEIEKVMAVRAILEDEVDWDCEVLWNYADSNLGCKTRIASGLDWVFEQVEEAIILEDDCLPHPDFFPFCQELLEHYRSHPQVMMVSGQGFWASDVPEGASYFFSKNALIWGWATWRRAWRLNQLDMPTWPVIRETSLLQDILENPRLVRKVTDNLDAVFRNQIDTWDLQWGYSIWVEDGLVVVPYNNLVTNIGFGDDSTHTRKIGTGLANYPASSISFPLRHPVGLQWNREHDRLLRETVSVLIKAPERKISRLKKKFLTWMRDVRHHQPDN